MHMNRVNCSVLEVAVSTVPLLVELLQAWSEGILCILSLLFDLTCCVLADSWFVGVNRRDRGVFSAAVR